jgi:hypothetical protein
VQTLRTQTCARFVLFALIGVGWALSQALAQLTPNPLPDNQQVLDRCQAVFSALRPQFMYAERVGQGGFAVRLVLGANGNSVVRLTLDSELQPIQMGLEDTALQPIRPLADRNRILTVVQRRFANLGQNLNLGNWYVGEPRGFRCFITHQGRVVGVIRLNLRFEPLGDPRWYNVYMRSIVRYPLEMPAVQPR